MVAEHVRRALASSGAPDPPGPYGVIDLDALEQNIADLRHRTGGLPVRVASKSLRVPQALAHVLEHPGYHGVMAFSLPEALALHEEGFRDVLVGYPTTHRPSLARLAADAAARAHLTLMVDSSEHLDLIRAVHAQTAAAGPLRVCLDADASLVLAGRLTRGRLRFGMRRSPVHSVEQATRLARLILADPRRLRLVGVMGYEGQIAGLGDRGHGPRALGIRALQRRSARELGERRTGIVRAVRELTDLEFVNGGGTGSLETSAGEGGLTEVAAGSGLFSPGLFDGYRGFRHRPAAYFVAPVVRHPAPGWVTVQGAGLVASGPPGADRLPRVEWPPALRYSMNEGAGEVQTPLHGAAADGMALGDPVFFRHAKAGEPAERIDEYLVVSGGSVVDVWKTYRGRGWTF